MFDRSIGAFFSFIIAEISKDYDSNYLDRELPVSFNRWEKQPLFDQGQIFGGKWISAEDASH